MRKLLMILLSISLVGCLNEPQSSERTGKDNKFEIEFLFEKDGIKMYRFYDGGYFHYFTTNGTTITQQTSGKSTYDETIETNLNK
jgi:hypothetical protein